MKVKYLSISQQQLLLMYWSCCCSNPATLKRLKRCKNKYDKRKASRSMITLLLLNISSLTLFPSTIISLMHSFNSKSTNTLYLLLFVTTSIGTILRLCLIRYLLGFIQGGKKNDCDCHLCNDNISLFSFKKVDAYESLIKEQKKV